jgi:hypothetical protein
MCTGNKLFPAMTLARKWWTAMRHDTQWQTIHIPEHIFDVWRSLARESGAKVSDFDLFASWIQLVGTKKIIGHFSSFVYPLTKPRQNLADFAQSLDSDVPERLVFSISMRKTLGIQQESPDEIANPISIAVSSPFPRTRASNQSKLIDGAVNIRSTINTIRHPQYALDYADLMAQVPQRQTQMRNMGKRAPASLMLTSWSHAPFGELEIWSDEKHSRETALLQPVIGAIPAAPVPGRSKLDPQIGVIWKGKGGDGYWFTANLEERLWRGILDVAL